MSVLDPLRRFLPPALGGRRPPIVTVLRLDGVIGAMGGLRAGLTIAGTAALIEKAFAAKPLSAVALVINSPGGAAAQSALIHDRIRALADEKKVPVFAFCEDVAASGGYMLALAADRIYAHPMSIVGSIGVISGGFGFDKAIGKLGIERRVYTAGVNKHRLDPFLPESAEDVTRLKQLQATIHADFKAMVAARRGARLAAGEDELFNGDVWTGRQAVELGLIDGVGDIRSKLRAEFGPKVRLVPIAQRRRLFPFGPRLAGRHGLAGAALAGLEERGLWSRFGL
ncbi:S49 family peptidase [Zavarzinia compransoris]|uniref:S49 family peptidase n=1 Tax=Zavarzinia compransoris TaxID=1264899 RepID=A0A317E0L4_9PROT|nr:S49 family peptidase [Zavarzinia compransoris]PWR20588.1 S49 family peptidase [Zavarzinia compransoris]TDP43766.1 signal peptide peptidase SppA [Zavarzinia compransoris]